MRRSISWQEMVGLGLELGKAKIALFAASSSLAAYVLAVPILRMGFFVPWTAVLILALGAAALNQFQERGLDGRMARTKRRPIPARRVEPGWALGFSVLLIFLGCLILASLSLMAGILAAWAVIWYNGIYTHLKRFSAFAAVPGALTGAFPPAIGWVCGGGSLADARLWTLCLFFFVWQVPHFWAISVDRSEEYRMAGLRTPGDLFSEAQIRRIVFHWILATAACSLLISFSGAVRSTPSRAGIFILAFWLIIQAVPFRRPGGCLGLTLFQRMNRYMFLVLLSLSLDWLPAALRF